MSTPFEFTSETDAAAKAHIAKYPEGRQQSAVMPILDLAQRQNGGWLTQEIMEYIADYLDMAAELRNAGIRAEVYMGNGNMGKQLKYADQRQSAVAVIEGSQERDNGIVQLKDLALGARLAANIETHEDWSSQPAQMEVARGDLVAEVRKMIARGDG